MISSDNGLFRVKLISEQCWLIICLTLRNNLKWNVNQNATMFIQKSAFENGCQMSAILSRLTSTCLGVVVDDFFTWGHHYLTFVMLDGTDYFDNLYVY